MLAPVVVCAEVEEDVNMSYESENNNNHTNDERVAEPAA